MFPFFPFPFSMGDVPLSWKRKRERFCAGETVLVMSPEPEAPKELGIYRRFSKGFVWVCIQGADREVPVEWIHKLRKTYV